MVELARNHNLLFHRPSAGTRSISRLHNHAKDVQISLCVLCCRFDCFVIPDELVQSLEFGCVRVFVRLANGCFGIGPTLALTDVHRHRQTLDVRCIVLYADALVHTVDLEVRIESWDVVYAGFICYCKTGILEQNAPERKTDGCSDNMLRHTERFPHDGEIMRTEATKKLQHEDVLFRRRDVAIVNQAFCDNLRRAPQQVFRVWFGEIGESFGESPGLTNKC